MRNEDNCNHENGPSIVEMILTFIMHHYDPENMEKSVAARTFAFDTLKELMKTHEETHQVKHAAAKHIIEDIVQKMKTMCEQEREA